VGADPDQVVVEPNLDFADDGAPVADLVRIVQAKVSGAPLSWRTIHDWARAREFTDKPWEEELEEINAELVDIGAGGGTPVDLDPTARPALPPADDEETP
jgi:hypothetical protein